MSEPPAILIVEDDVPTCTFLADNLTADGYDVVCAASLADALRTLEHAGIDLAVVDVGLPDGSGLELLRKVREAGGPGSRIDPRLPLVVVSGRAGETDRVRGFERGADDFVAKPFAYGELRLRVAALLRRSRERRADGRLRVGELLLDPLAREVRVRGVGSGSRRRSSRCCARWRATPRACGPRPSCCATCGASARSARPARSTRTRAGCAEAGHPGRSLRPQRLGRRLPARRRRGGRSGRDGDRRGDGGAGVSVMAVVAKGEPA